MALKRNSVSAANEQLIASCLPEFYALVPNEQAALDLILQTQVQQRRLRCGCGYVFETVKRAEYDRKVQCTVCRKKIHFTVGTLYEGVTSVRARLGAVWLMDHGAVVTSTKLNQLFGIATSTGLNIINTIGLFIESMRAISFDRDSTKVNCPAFAEIMIKRSRICGAYEHASAIPEEVSVCDVDLNTETSSAQHSNSSNTFEDLGDLDREVLAQISGTPISVDTICENVDQPAGPVGAVLTMLEILGHITSAPGNSFVRLMAAKENKSETEFSPELMEFVAAAIASIKAIRQGVSRKYLQLYLGAFWCHFERSLWREGSLMLICLDSTLSPDRNLIDYESPLMVSVASG